MHLDSFISTCVRQNNFAIIEQHTSLFSMDRWPGKWKDNWQTGGKIEVAEVAEALATKATVGSSKPRAERWRFCPDCSDVDWDCSHSNLWRAWWVAVPHPSLQALQDLHLSVWSIQDCLGKTLSCLSPHDKEKISLFVPLIIPWWDAEVGIDAGLALNSPRSPSRHTLRHSCTFKFKTFKHLQRWRWQ